MRGNLAVWRVDFRVLQQSTSLPINSPLLPLQRAHDSAACVLWPWIHKFWIAVMQRPSPLDFIFGPVCLLTYFRYLILILLRDSWNLMFQTRYSLLLFFFKLKYTSDSMQLLEFTHICLSLVRQKIDCQMYLSFLPFAGILHHKFYFLNASGYWKL